MANKENRGWIKPTEFNLLAERAQLDVLKDRVGTVSPDAVSNGYRENSKLYDELRTVITYDTNLTPNAAGDFAFPADYLYFLNVRFNDREVEIVDHGELTKRRNSFLNPPSEEFPIGVITSAGIRIFNNANTGNVSAGALRLTYVSEPATPVWAFSTVNNIEIYNVTGSTQLELPESTHKEIAHRILAYVGVELREASVVEYGTSTVLEQNK